MPKNNDESNLFPDISRRDFINGTLVGFGAALLQRPSKVATLIEAMRAAVSVPITIKMRLGWSADKPSYLKVARAAEEAGAAAIALHARSRAQRYRRPADWTCIRELTEAVSVPVIGNGDILTWRDAKQRLRETGCAGVMVGRWGLAKPWMFREFETESDVQPDTEQRLAIIRRYVELCRELFGDDEKGRERTRRFLVFHQDFFRRYRPRAGIDAVNSDDPRDWGRPPESELESWLDRGDLPAVEALCRWLVDGEDPVPPGEARDAPRAVRVRALG